MNAWLDDLEPQGNSPYGPAIRKMEAVTQEIDILI
jgi:hypothetical protein